MAKAVVEQFAVAPDAVFQAAQAVAGEMAKTVDGVDPARRTLYFNTGMSLWSWNGQNVTVAVADDGAGGSTMHVEPQVKRSGLSSLQLVSWGEGPRVAKKFAARVRDRLGAPTPGV
jgi:hypothetical protein